MQILRPIQHHDFAALKQIAIESGHGFTSLPVDDEVLSKKIANAEASFDDSLDKRGEQDYLFVLEDAASGEILGTTAIKASVGLSAPIYHYRHGNIEQRSSRLNLVNSVPILTMCNDYTGASEICTLFLREHHRNGFAGRLLSRVRFLFMAQHPQRFSDTIIAEMRGVSDENGHSPFWHWLKTHYIDREFPEIDHMIGTGNNEFIEQLMPKYPIYQNLLDDEAKNVIGEVHDKTRPALKLLQREGFKSRGYYDLFDAGPTIEAKLNEINTVSDSEVAIVSVSNSTHLVSDHTFALCNHKVSDFRATASNQIHWDKTKQQIALTPALADALRVETGDDLRLVRLCR